jgi:Protein of unknown function (DUF1501)
MSPRMARREFLQAGTLALFAGAGPSRAAYAAGSGGGKAKRCILIYLLGGPSHIDMWDLKPEAPAEIRGPFKPIKTNVPGIEIGEHLPKLARQAHRLAIVRSVTFPNGDHPFMTYYTLTGRVSSTPLGANTVLPPSRADHPHMGSVVAKFRHDRADRPGYVAIPEVRVRMQPVPVAGGGRAGFLGPRYDPLAINEDPRAGIADLELAGEISAARFDRRRTLLAVVDGKPAASAPAGEYGAFRANAARLVRAAAGEDLFQLEKEPAALQERYGTHRFGQSLLLARRLVERGVSFVGLHFNHMTKCDGWDTHADNFNCLKGELLPMLDGSLAALLDDLASRGLLEETLVVVMGEFGRTPQINAKAGRDHWGECASVVFAGGGIRRGTIVGASDRFAAAPAEGAVGPPDVIATIYHALGLEPHALMHDPLLGRDMTLCDGEVIRGLF